MERLVFLGILTMKSTSHTSPVKLITRKLTKDKRPVVDFRPLNTKIFRQNTSIPLMSDALCNLGNAECEVLSCVDLNPFTYCYKLHVHTDAFFGILFLCVYINIHILDICIDVCMYVCVYTCMNRCYMTV